MENEYNNEHIEHIIKIDEYLSVNMKIPKILDAMELKALTTKANKLLNLSEVTTISIPKAPSGRWKFTWTQEMDNMLTDLRNQGLGETRIARKMSEKFNLDVRHYNVRLRTKFLNIPTTRRKPSKSVKIGNFTPTTNKQRRIEWTSEMVKYISHAKKTNVSYKNIAKRASKKFGVNLKDFNVRDKLRSLKK